MPDDITAQVATQVDRMIDERPGKVLLTASYDDVAVPLNDFIYSSGGHTNAYLIVTDAGRIVVNTGLGYEAPHHRRVFDEVCGGPTPYVITTQGHTDHVGGVAAFRAPETTYVAQRDNRLTQHQDARIRDRMRRWSAPWFGADRERIASLARERTDVPATQDTPTPDLAFDERIAFTVGGLDIELLHGTGETTDGAIVWLPQHGIAVISNLLGPLFCHFPNLNTLRGQRYRFVEPYLATIRRIRELTPEMLVTGRGEPIVGATLIDACLQRMHDAVDFVHRETLRGINSGADLAALMQEIRLPAELRVGEGYGKVSWGVRTIWESYLGWFQHDRTSTLYPLDQSSVLADLVELAGADNVQRLAADRMSEGRFVEATALGEALASHAPGDPAALRVLARSHRGLLKDPAAQANFWLSGWLEYQLARFTEARDGEGASRGCPS